MSCIHFYVDYSGNFLLRLLTVTSIVIYQSMNEMPEMFCILTNDTECDETRQQNDAQNPQTTSPPPVMVPVVCFLVGLNSC